LQNQLRWSHLLLKMSNRKLKKNQRLKLLPLNMSMIDRLHLLAQITTDRVLKIPHTAKGMDNAPLILRAMEAGLLINHEKAVDLPTLHAMDIAHPILLAMETDLLTNRVKAVLPIRHVMDNAHLILRAMEADLLINHEKAADPPILHEMDNAHPTLRAMEIDLLINLGKAQDLDLPIKVQDRHILPEMDLLLGLLMPLGMEGLLCRQESLLQKNLPVTSRTKKLPRGLMKNQGLRNLKISKHPARELQSIEVSMCATVKDSASIQMNRAGANDALPINIAQSNRKRSFGQKRSR
jgi:hypothetical protein